MTLVLAVESATDAAGVALADGDGLVAELVVGRGRRHAETIAPAVETVCQLAGVRLDDVAAVAVDVGPGLFTGLRVGIATAKGIAFALGLPMVPVTSLDVLAAAAAAAAPAVGEDRTVLAVVDARRGEVFWARYRLAPAGVGATCPPAPVPMSDPVSCPPSVLAGEVAAMAAAGLAPLLVGEGAVRYAAELAAAGAVVADPLLAHPPVGVLASLGVRAVQAGRAVDAAGVDAVYVRDADARINWEQRRPARPVAEAPGVPGS